jgi:PKD domain-containing protein
MSARRFLVLAATAATLAPAAVAVADTGSSHYPVVSFTVAPLAPKTGDTLTLTANASDPDGDLVPGLVRWDLDGDGNYETLGTTATVRLDRGPHTIGVRATDYFNHSTTVTKVVTVADAAPTAASFTWSPSAPRTGQSVTLTGTGSDPENDPLTYSWDLNGDGVYETSGAKPTASFSRGARKVGLKVSDPSGASFTTTQTINVGNAPPSGDFTWDSASPLSNTPVHLTATNIADPDDAAAAISVAWDLDDDGVYDASGRSADTTFAHPGAHTVAMRLTDPQGDSVVVRHAVDVANRPPVAAFDVNPGAPHTGDDITLTARGTDPDGGTMQLTSAWDLDGDGQFDDATGDVAHVSFLAGPHVVRLRVTDGNGAGTVVERTLDVTTPITVLEAPAPFVGTSAAAPLAPQTTKLRPMAPYPVVRLRGRVAGSGVLIDLLSIKNVPAAAHIAASCKGAGCHGLTRALARNGKGGKIAKVLARRTLGAGAVLEIRVTQPGAIGKLVRFTFRRGRAPLRFDGCLTPAGQPGPCS